MGGVSVLRACRWMPVAILLVAACGAPPTAPGPTPDATMRPSSTAAAQTPLGSIVPGHVEVPGSIGEALAVAGPVPQQLYFTDWAAIREAADATQLTGASGFEEKALAIRNEAPLAAFGLPYLRTHATDWGFDVFDLDWEASAEQPGASLQVLRLRDQFDLSSLTRKLDEYGFATEKLPHGILRSLSMDNMARLGGSANPALVGTGLQFLNTGILDDGRTLVLAPASGQAVRTILTEGPREVADPSLRSVARLLDGPAAAVIQVGDLCAAARQSIDAAQSAVRLSIAELLADAGALRAYNALAIGYAWQPALRARIVLGYPGAPEATADLDGRRLLAERGFSLLGQGSYRERVFTVADARVEGQAVVLQLGRPTAVLPTGSASLSGPTELLPRVLLLTLRRDYLFGACSE